MDAGGEVSASRCRQAPSGAPASLGRAAVIRDRRFTAIGLTTGRLRPPLRSPTAALGGRPGVSSEACAYRIAVVPGSSDVEQQTPPGRGAVGLFAALALLLLLSWSVARRDHLGPGAGKPHTEHGGAATIMSG